MRCAICGKRIDENRESNLYFFICSKKCQDEFNRRVEEIFRQRHSNLIGKSLIIDPAVGDEYEIARTVAKMRIEEELSRPVRLENLRENLKKHGLEHWTPYAEHLMFLNERQTGSNIVNVMLDGKLYTIFYSGDIEPAKGCGCYFWIRVDGGWVEERPDDSPRKFIPDEKISFGR